MAKDFAVAFAADVARKAGELRAALGRSSSAEARCLAVRRMAGAIKALNGSAEIVGGIVEGAEHSWAEGGGHGGRTPSGRASGEDP